jgi:hypothetical protein
MKQQYDIEDNDGCVVPIWWVFILVILCLGEPDLLDGLIHFLNNTACN